jgi:hypothetical protein
MNIVIKKAGQMPYAIVGDTVLCENEIFSHYGKKGIDVICKNCGFPFSVSLEKHGKVIDTVLCFGCSKEIAAIIKKN